MTETMYKSCCEDVALALSGWLVGWLVGRGMSTLLALPLPYPAMSLSVTMWIVPSGCMRLVCSVVSYPTGWGASICNVEF